MIKKEKAIILLSSGLDSLTALAIYRQQYEIVRAIFFDYGQKAVRQEKKNAKKISKFYQIALQIIDLGFLLKKSNSSLTEATADIPKIKMADLNNPKITAQGAKKVWVPNRNGLFLNVAAVIAEQLAVTTILTGFNEEEAVTFPDNSKQFMKVAEKFFSFSTKNGLRVKGLNLKKEQILQKALDLSVPLQYLWSCYYGKKTMCGQCESCRRLQRAFVQLGIADRCIIK